MLAQEECMEKFKDAYSHRLDDKTVDLYQKAVIQLLENSGKPFYEITSRDIRIWQNHMDMKGYKPVTIKTKLAGVKLFFRYCMEEKVLFRNPAETVPFPQIEDKLPRYLQMEELIHLRRLVEGKADERAIMEMLYSTGIRISELAAVKKEDINWNERFIHIPKGKRKKARIVCFTRDSSEHLKAYLEQRQDDLPYVFVNTTGSGPVCKRTIQKKFKAHSKHLGFSLTPHTLRHTFAAHLAMKGMPLACIQTLLGHDSPHQTQLYARLYSHVRKQIYDEFM